jgi:CheY-like chemotaxis protein
LARKILLADDSVTAQNMGRRILSEAGYEVVTVNNGSAALKKIAEQKPDLIILDVYMPGYGGVEVCQRIKESPETARVPVLLTVGKLEPFKAEEARRVHADAHLVKPFEASELLTALTKLEDKIVPEPEPRPSRSSSRTRSEAKPAATPKTSTAAATPKASPEVQFGDTATGWKSRLTIPASTPKVEPAAESEPAAAAHTTSTAFRNFARREQPEPAEPSAAEAPVVEAPAVHPPVLPTGMLQDITAEEIAAIAAAANAFGGNSDSAGGETEVEAEAPAPPQVEAATAEIPQPEYAAAEIPAPDFPPAEAAYAAPVEEFTPAEVREPVAETAGEAAFEPPAAEAVQEEVAQEQVAPQNEYPETAVASAVEEPPAETQPPAAEAQPDAELAAAIASLAPANGNAHEYAPAFEDSSLGQFEHVRTVAEPAVDNMWNAAPRWIAEEVPVAADEASLVLEQEMQKAYAAMAEMEAGPQAGAEEPAAIAQMESPGDANEDPYEAAPSQIAEVPEAAASLDTTPPPEAISEAAAETATESAPQAVAEPAEAAESSFAPVETAAIEQPAAEEPAPVETEARAEEFAAESQPVDAVSATVVESTHEPEPAIAAEIAPQQAVAEQTSEAIAEQTNDVAAETRSEAAYAAAAATGLGFRTIAHGDGAAAEPANELASQPAAGEPASGESDISAAENSEREAELAAAWAHWRQIRESVANPQFTAQVADAAAAGIKDMQQAPAQPAGSSSSVSSDPSAIASIVDSVLAELKPKLVEEIAKKLGKEK